MKPPIATREPAVEKRPGRAAPPPRVGQGLTEIYRNTVRSRCLDERMAAWAAAGQLGFYLPALEWGGPLAAVAAALEAGDWLFPGAREARLALWRGLGLPDFLAQHLGLELGSGAGFLPTLPGSIADVSHRVASVAGGPAAHLPHAVGVAYAEVYRQEKNCAVAICSAAAVDSPDFHVACNFAGVWRVPVAFLVRGERQDAATVEVEARAEAYGLTAARADGNDLEAIWKAVREALECGRRGGGATLVEIGQPDDDGGLAGLRKKLGNGSRPDDAALAAEAAAWCEESWAAARAAARPGIEKLTAAVYAGPERHLTDELADLTQTPTSLPEDV